jgi:hypothetical protein
MAVSGVAAAALTAGGAAVRTGDDAALRRLRSSLWLAGSAATGLLAGVAAVGAGADAPEVIVVAVAPAVALHSGALRWRHDLPVQHATLVVALVVTAGAVAAQVGETGAIGLTVWVTAVALLLAGLRRWVPMPVITEALGTAAAVVGATITSNQWTAAGLLLAAGTGLALVTATNLVAVDLDRADRLAIGVPAAVGLLQVVPGNLGYFAQDAAIPTGLVTWALGGAAVVLGARSLARTPTVAELVGGIALIGGAALTGAESSAFASLLGIATGIALVAAGVRPDQVLLSILGAIALLINVLWAIGRFFPGQARAPVLITVAGALTIGFAVLLSRSGRLGPPHSRLHAG